MPHTKRAILAILLVASVIGLHAHALVFAQTIVAKDDFDSQINRISFAQDPIPNSFISAGDGFEKYQVGVSVSIPFALLDDSFSVFPPDPNAEPPNPGDILGIVDASADSPGYKDDAWFGTVDLVNGDNPSGMGTATWVFDIADATDLEVSIDMAAMGDFESGADTYDWTYEIDSNGASPLFTSSVNEDISADYTLANPTSEVQTLNDPMLMENTNGTMIQLSNVFQTATSPIPGTGSTLTIQLVASGNGGSEAYAFDDILIQSNPGGMSAVDLDNDGDVDGADFLMIQRTNPSLITQWQAEYGSGVGGLSAASAVPEPASMALVGWAVALIAQVRRRRGSWRS